MHHAGVEVVVPWGGGGHVHHAGVLMWKFGGKGGECCLVGVLGSGG